MIRATFTVLLSLALAGEALGQDPFQPGMRWIHGAAPLDPWQPQNASFAAHGALLWGSAAGPGGHLFLLDAHALGAAEPRHRIDLDPSVTSVASAVGGTSGRLFAVTQRSLGGSAGVSTEVAAYDPVASSGSAELTPSWTYSFGGPNAGAVRIASDGSGDQLAVALWDPGQARIVVDILAGVDGGLISRSFHPAPSLDELAISPDGRHIAAIGGSELYLLSESGELLYHEARPATTRALALSGDGNTLAVGRPGALDLYRLSAGAWSPLTSVPAHPEPAKAGAWMPTKVALAQDGNSFAVGLWQWNTGLAAAFELHELGGRKQRHVQSDAGMGRQNLPVAVAISADGMRAAFGTWGNGLDPEALLVDRDEHLPLLEIDLPGSARTLALDPTGTRLAVGHRDAHAGISSSTGAMRLYDTGERQLQQLGIANIGGTMNLAAQYPGAGLLMLLVGVPSAPTAVAGVPGKLLVERSTLGIQLVPTNAAGRGDLAVPAPPIPSWVGSPFVIQAAFRLPQSTVLGPHLFRPLFF